MSWMTFPTGIEWTPRKSARGSHHYRKAPELQDSQAGCPHSVVYSMTVELMPDMNFEHMLKIKAY